MLSAKSRFFIRAASLVFLIAAWWVASLAIGESLVPSPVTVAVTSYENLTTVDVASHFVLTFKRVILGLALAMAIGIPFGILMGLSRVGEYFLDTWVMVGLMIPSLSYGAILLILIGINDYAAILAVGISTFPIVAINIWQGVKNIDNRLSEMAIAFNASKRKRLLKVVLPQLYPCIMAALRYGLGIVWKVTIVVELLGLTSGVGYMVMYWFTLFRMHQVLSWTIMFALAMLVIEYVILKKLENWLLGWREEVAL